MFTAQIGDRIQAKISEAPEYPWPGNNVVTPATLVDILNDGRVRVKSQSPVNGIDLFTLDPMKHLSPLN